MPIGTLERERWHPAIEIFIRDRASKTPASVERELKAMAFVPASQGGLGLPKAATSLPGTRTIKRRLAAYRAEQAEANPQPWTLFSSDLHDLEYVVEAQALQLASRADPLTEAMAEAVARVHRAAPDLDMFSVLRVARWYVDDPEMRPALEIFLGRRPWSGAGVRKHWDEIMERSQVPDRHRRVLDALVQWATKYHAVVTEGVDDPDRVAKSAANAPRKQSQSVDDSGRTPRSAKRGASVKRKPDQDL